MKNDHTDSKFKELLDKLQQESWQLELLISGFAIFGLISSIAPLENLLNRAKAVESYSEYLYPIVLLACWVLIINLIVHVVLRGLWIGAIGLRYVSGEINYESLNYRKRFTNHLEKKVGSFDKYINTLENYCSILFAITFLYLFYIISFFLIILILVLTSNFLMKSGLFPDVVASFILFFFGLFYVMVTLVVFIDFITQGYLKKVEWTSFLYLPIYKVFTVITFSFLYRPLVYNVLDDKFSRRLTFILTPIYILIFTLTTFHNVRSNYFIESRQSSIFYTHDNNYLDAIPDNEYVRVAAIQSKIIEENYIQIFIPFLEKIETNILSQNKELKTEEDKTGYSTRLFKNNDYSHKNDSINRLYLKAFDKIYSMKIDDTKIYPEFSFTKYNNQLGFEALVPLKSFPEGKHILNINELEKSRVTKEMEENHFIHLPFWYYKN